MTHDPTEGVRRMLVEQINVGGSRGTLEAAYGQVWDTQQLQEDFTVHSFLAPLIHVTRKADGAEGSMMFQHMPRFYFGFIEKEGK